MPARRTDDAALGSARAGRVPGFFCVGRWVCAEGPVRKAFQRDRDYCILQTVPS